MCYDAHKQPDPRLNGVHSSSACPPIATVMADVAALTLCARNCRPFPQLVAFGKIATGRGHSSARRAAARMPLEPARLDSGCELGRGIERLSMLIGLIRSQERNRLRRLRGPMISILSERVADSSDSFPTQTWIMLRMSVVM